MDIFIILEVLGEVLKSVNKKNPYIVKVKVQKY